MALYLKRYIQHTRKHVRETCILAVVAFTQNVSLDTIAKETVYVWHSGEALFCRSEVNMCLVLLGQFIQADVSLAAQPLHRKYILVFLYSKCHTHTHTHTHTHICFTLAQDKNSFKAFQCSRATKSCSLQHQYSNGYSSDDPTWQWSRATNATFSLEDFDQTFPYSPAPSSTGPVLSLLVVQTTFL